MNSGHNVVAPFVFGGYNNKGNFGLVHFLMGLKLRVREEGNGVIIQGYDKVYRPYNLCTPI